MSARIRLLLAAGCLAVYSTVPTLRTLYPLMSNAGMCAQRVESLAHAVVRVQLLTQVFRRTP